MKAARARAPGSAARCPVCGSALPFLLRRRRLGCAACYETFAPPFGPLLGFIHGTAAARPARGRRGGLRGLRLRLQEAILLEDFERAARLRDLIRRAAKPGRDGGNTA